MKELVDIVYDVATKTPKEMAKKVMTLLIQGYTSLPIAMMPTQPQDIRTETLNKTMPIASGETTKAVERTTKKKKSRKKRSSRKAWTATEMSILRSKNLTKSAKIAELKKVGRSKQAVLSKAWSLGIPLENNR